MTWATWFTDHADARTPLTLERERYVLWHPATGAFQRWMIVLPVLLVQVCIGSMYSWSIFNAALDRLWGAPGLNTNAFLLSIACFGLCALLCGTWVERNGPFRAVRLTILLTPLGWGLASLGSYNGLFGVELLYGVAHGLGTGLAYLSVTSSLQRWYPELKGLATGVAVMGFGLGSFIWTTLGKNLLAPAAQSPYGHLEYGAALPGAAVFACGLGGCSYSAPRRYAVLDHQRRMHNSDLGGALACKTCAFVTESHEDLLAHVQHHNGMQRAQARAAAAAAAAAARGKEERGI